MSRLILMRHAKSSWSDAGQTDHQRPLNARGRRSAPQMAHQLVSTGWHPELALVSDAARTEETWAWMSDALGAGCRLELLPSLYHGTLHEILEAIAAHQTGESTILALGHNPGWESAVGALSGHRLAMKTANVALLTHPEPWARAISRRDWTLSGILTPPR